MSESIPYGKKSLTTQQRAAHDRLRTIWDRKKKSLGLTQLKVARTLKISQSGLAKYLNGINPLNEKVILRFCELLHVQPHEVDPALAHINLGVSCNVVQNFSPCLITHMINDEPLEKPFVLSGVFLDGTIKLVFDPKSGGYFPRPN